MVSSGLYAQLVGVGAGLLLLTAVLIVWRHSLRSSIRLLAVQGVGLAWLVAVIGLHAGEAALVAVAALVGVLKAGLLPWVLARGAAVAGVQRDESRLNPTSSLLIVAVLTALAYLVAGPLLAASTDPAVRAVPVGLALVLIGFLQLVTRRRALSQLVGFLLLDNGIAAVAFLTAGGVPLVVELGVSLDVLLVVLILRVLTSRMQAKFGGTDLDELTELRD
jgi:hydrogenase-4 component E